MSTDLTRRTTDVEPAALPRVEFWETDVEAYPPLNPWVAPLVLYLLPLSVLVAIVLAVAYTR